MRGVGNDNEKIRNIEQFKGTESVAPKANKKSLKFPSIIYKEPSSALAVSTEPT